MPLLRRALPLIPLCVGRVLADFVDLRNPAPADLTSDESLVSASWENVTAVLDEYVKGNQDIVPGAENVTFSTSVFSIHDPAAVETLQYHYTAPEVANAPTGTNKVDSASIYRVASISKLVTVFGGMLDLTSEEWNRPLTDILPELAEFSRNNPDADPVHTTQWDKITPWALASQIAGVARNGIAGADLLLLSEMLHGPNAPDPVSFGLPPLDVSELGPCGEFPTGICPEKPYLGSVGWQAPTFLPWTSPGYSNNGFILLGLALSKLTGEPLDTWYNKAIFEPLGMTSSNISVPPKSDWSRSVIVGDPAITFAFSGGITRPSGGVFSTIDDLAKFGIGILNNTLLPADQTRKWMKPISHTASLTYSVGAPWEIFRYIHKSTGRTTDVYTKAGDSGAYGGFIALVPEYDAGFSILTAYTGEALRSSAATLFGDVVVQHIIPALDAQATREAQRNFAGHYASTVEGLNSSLTVSLNETSPDPRLVITSWISNGTQMLDKFHSGKKPLLHASIPDQGDGKVAFRASTNPQASTYPEAGEGIGPLMGSYAINADWLVVDGSHYGGIGVDLFVFDINTDGRAAAVSPAVTRAKLERKQTEIEL